MSAPADTRQEIAPALSGARARIGSIDIIPASIVTGLILAVAGGFYVWREIHMMPEVQNRNGATSVEPVTPSPASAPVVSPILPSAPSTDNPISPSPPPVTEKKQPDPDNLSESKAPAAPTPPIRVEHSHESNVVDPVLLAAWQAYRNGDLDIATQHYNEVLRKDEQNQKPANRDALLGMAAIARQRSQDAIAAQYYKQLLALDPRDPDAHAGISLLSGASGEAGMESRLKLLLAQHPEAAALHFALGNYYAEQSRWSEAEQVYFSACNLEPENAQFAFNLAVSLDHLGQDKLAAQHYRRALQSDHAINASFDHAQTRLRLDELSNH